MTIELGPADTGTSRSVRVGELTTVRLPESPTTGYRWECDEPGAGLLLVEDRFEGATTPRGSGGERVLVFQAVSTGPATLRLVNRRSWGSADPGEEFSVQFDVQPPALSADEGSLPE
ncbi:MAG TPA: protease inhibitor I42 family protein [Actinomycetes bacterium]